MADHSNIPTGLKITSQIPLDVKKYVKNENTLAYLGINNNLAFTYHDQLEVLCLAEKSIYVWREVRPGEENTGLVPLDFTYPLNLPETYGINYSGKRYNFFIKEYVTTDNIANFIAINNVGEGVEIYKDATTVGSNTQFNFRSLTSSGGSVTITQELDSVNLEVSVAPTTICLTSKDKTVLVTEAEGCFDLSVYSPKSVNVGTGENVYKTFNLFAYQNEFKTLKSNNNTIVLSPSTDELSLEVNNLQKEIIARNFPYTLTDNEDKYTIFLDNGSQKVIVYVPENLKPGFTCSFIQKGTGDVIITGNGLDATNVITPSNLQNVIKGKAYGCFLEKEFNTPNYYLVGGLKLV